ncbi:uncharacterized protein LOC132745334 [Ruditapes philippinarum]|uniref:uncharacterized protein LOC132745334 n=1 Tax=Ruditapes philippinarum TaxID=129788 RepID=UPI00295C3765|nr:uncharacterized protein LOC132745334 [Ruditapes philippinarum]
MAKTTCMLQNRNKPFVRRSQQRRKRLPLSIVSNASDGVEELVNVGELRPDYVARVVNRYRQELRPDEPVDMDFELDENAISHDFYRREVKVEDRRHLIFATDNQLDLLSQALRWYIDGTFKVI